MKMCSSCGTRFSEPVAFCPHDGTPTVDIEVAPPPDPLLGRVIDGRYRVEKPIGEGGMGIVYAISHAVLGKRMALKVLRGDMAKDADVVQRFMQEAQSATSIGHANIIDISDFGRLPDGSVYFVMEYLDGQSLSKMISNGGSVPMATALHIIKQIASALEAAHARGIVHRDMKPDNIYLVRQGSDDRFVKVLDFGIAKVGGANSKLTRTGMIFGTPHYMSPEQAAGQMVDRRTDIYALGVIMYEMFTGKVPFDGDTFMGILSKHMFEQPIPPSQVQGKGLGAIEDIILKALAKKQEDRYQSMAELISDLDQIAAGGSVQIARRGGITPPGNAYSAAGLADALEPPSRTEMRLGMAAPMEPEPEPTLPRSRAPLFAAAVVALLFVAAGVGGVVFWITGSHAIAASTPAAPIAPVTTPLTGSTGTTGIAPGTAAATGAPALGAPALGAPAGAPVTGTPVAGTTVAGTTGTGAPTTPVAPTRMVEITSAPPGAQVLVDGAIVGDTPIQLPAPAEGERRAELRLRGYDTTSVMITRGSPDSLSVTLTQTRAASSTRRTHATTTPTTTPTETPPATPTTTRRPGTSSTSEVVDPWAQ